MRTPQGLVNFRDLGGLPLHYGGAVASGVLYRSAALTELTDAGLAELESVGVGIVVDLRTELEARSAPDRLPAGGPPELLRLPLLEGAFGGAALAGPEGRAVPAATIDAMLASLPTIPELYAEMLAHAGGAFAQIARRVAAARPGSGSSVLVHCTAGKDRTGVAVAVLLDAVRADREAIVADYASSHANLVGAWEAGMVAAIEAMGVTVTPSLRALVTATPAEAMVATIDRIDADYGGGAGYLAAAGLADDELAALRHALRAA